MKTFFTEDYCSSGMTKRLRWVEYRIRSKDETSGHGYVRYPSNAKKIPIWQGAWNYEEFFDQHRFHSTVQQKLES